MKSKKCLVSIVGFFLLIAATAIQADERAAKPAAGGDTEKQAFLDFVKQQRQQRWDFDDKMLQKSRQFQDEQLRQKRDAELEDETTLASSSDLNAGRKQVQTRREERAKVWRKKAEEFRTGVEKDRKAFQAQMQANGKAFRAAHGGVADSGKEQAPDKKKKKKTK